MGQLILDLFASRPCHQRPWYIALKLDLGSIAIDMFLDPWNREYDFAFPPCSLISRVLTKIFKEKTDHRIIVTPTWQTQPWYAQILKNVYTSTIPSASRKKFINKFTEENPSSCRSKVTENSDVESFHKSLQLEEISILSHIQEQKA